MCNFCCCLSVPRQCSEASVHPAFICIPGQKKLSESVAKALLCCRLCPFRAPSNATFLYVSIFPCRPHTKPQDNYGSPSSERTSTSFLNPAFSLSPSLPFCPSLSLFLSLPTLLAYDLLLLPSGKCGRMTY